MLLAAAPGALRGQESPADIRWLPAAPVEGSVFSVLVTPARGVVAARGSVSREPLHFEPASDGAYRAFAAVPIGARDSVPLQVHLEDSSAGVVEGAIVWIPVARRRVPTERIRTDPRFSRPPDSALAARIAREREQIRAVQDRTHHTPRLWRGPFVRPRGSRITSVFGIRRVVNGVPSGRHYGTDLDGNTGDPIRAANSGVIALTGHFYYGGCLVYVDHGAGLVTGYLHMSEVLVREGDTVSAGQVLGRVGATGRVTGPHLHWLANYGGISVDPLGLIQLDPGVPAGHVSAPAAPARRGGTPGLQCRP